MDFLIENGKIILSPHPENGLIDPEAQRFWFIKADLIDKYSINNNVEKNSTKNLNKNLSFLTNFLNLINFNETNANEENKQIDKMNKKGMYFNINPLGFFGSLEGSFSRF